jgi:hypothetical protein
VGLLRSRRVLKFQSISQYEWPDELAAYPGASAAASPHIRPLERTMPHVIPTIATRTDAPACGQVAGVLRHVLDLARSIAGLAART